MQLGFSKTKEPIIGSLKSKTAEIRHLENQHDVIFSTECGPIWIKFRKLVQNDMSTAMIWSKSKPDVEFQYGGCLGEFNGMSSHRATYHIAGCSWFMIPEPHATLHLHGVRITSAISKIVFRQSHKGFLYQSIALMRLLLILDMTIYWSKICVSSPFLPTPLI